MSGKAIYSASLLIVGLFFVGQGCSPTGATGGSQETDNGSDGLTSVVDAIVVTNNTNSNNSNSSGPSGSDDQPADEGGSAGPAGISVRAGAALSINENGTTAQFTVVLDRAPAADVTVPLASTNTAEGTVSSSSLTFTPANWSARQSVAVIGQNEFVDDGDVAFSVTVGPAASADPDFNGLSGATVSVTNRDNDTAGVTVLANSSLATSESGGGATFTIALKSQPTDAVSISLSSSAASEIAVAPAVVAFDATNWNVPQTVTLTGLDDALTDGGVAVTVATGAAVSNDSTYSGLAVADVVVINADDDTESFTLEPDDYAAGTALTNTLQAVTLSTTGNDNTIAPLYVVEATEDGLDLEPTGQRVLGHDGIQFFNSNFRLRMDFTQAAREIQITFGGGTFFDTEVGKLEVYDANDVMLAEYTTAPRGSDEMEVMTITRPTADIAWAVAYSQDSFGRLDYLVISVAK